MTFLIPEAKGPQSLLSPVANEQPPGLTTLPLFHAFEPAGIAAGWGELHV